MALAKDVEYLAGFVDSLGVPILRENLDELQQTVLLLQAENTDEFYDISTRNKKYGRVDAMNGPLLLEKYASNFVFAKENENTVLILFTDFRAHLKALQKQINSQHFPLSLRGIVSKRNVDMCGGYWRCMSILVYMKDLGQDKLHPHYTVIYVAPTKLETRQGN